MAAEIRLDQATYNRLLQSERELHDLIAELDKAEECGIDCTAHKADREDALARISAIKKNYAPKSR